MRRETCDLCGGGLFSTAVTTHDRLGNEKRACGISHARLLRTTAPPASVQRRTPENLATLAGMTLMQGGKSATRKIA